MFFKGFKNRFGAKPNKSLPYVKNMAQTLFICALLLIEDFLPVHYDYSFAAQ